MAHRLVFDPSVLEDLVKALEYYVPLSTELAERFKTSVDRRLSAIAENPESYPMDTAPVRFAKVDRFPYLIFFVVKPEFVSVIAVLHGSSNPKKWRNRSRKIEE